MNLKNAAKKRVSFHCEFSDSKRNIITWLFSNKREENNMDNNGKAIVTEVIRTMPLKDLALVRLSDGSYASYIGIGEVGLNLGAFPEELLKHDVDFYDELHVATKEFDEFIKGLPICFLPERKDIMRMTHPVPAEKSKDIDIVSLLMDPAVHDWLKARVSEIDKRDIVDLINDTEIFLRVLKQRFRKTLGEN